MRLITERIILVSSVILFVTVNVYGQKASKSSKGNGLSLVDVGGNAGASDVTGMGSYKATYSLAMKYGDYTSATQSVYGMIAVDSSNQGLKDTLANLFFARGLYQQCIMLAGDIYKNQPGNKRMLELLAVSQQSLGNNKEALDYYDKLYSGDKQLGYLYQMVILQYALKRIGECGQNIETIVNDPDAQKQQVAINVGQGYQQSVPYKAAALNIRGVIASDLNDTTLARKSFEEALKSYPDFIIAKNNLAGLNKANAAAVTAGDKNKGVANKK